MKRLWGNPHFALMLVAFLSSCTVSPRYRTRASETSSGTVKMGDERLQEDEERARQKGARAGAYQIGVSSYYGKKFHGRPTASGEPFDMHALTAAHRTLSFATEIRVTNLENGLSVIVRVNDRGPFVEERVLDLSYAAARKIDMIGTGTAMVKIEIVGGEGR